jgi:hypothetical protein
LACYIGIAGIFVLLFRLFGADEDYKGSGIRWLNWIAGAAAGSLAKFLGDSIASATTKFGEDIREAASSVAKSLADFAASATTKFQKYIRELFRNDNTNNKEEEEVSLVVKVSGE